MKKKILVISHDFVKKVNIKVYEELGKKKKYNSQLCKTKKTFFKWKKL